MKQSTYTPISTTTTSTAADTSTVSTPTPPTKAGLDVSAVLISCETTDGRFTFDGTSPAGGTGSHKIPKDQPPLLLLLGPGATIKAVSTAAAVCVINITWLS